MNAIDALAAFTSSFHPTAISAAGRASLQSAMMDFIGCTMAGARTEHARAARAAFSEAGDGRSRLIGTATTASSHVAAFLNAHACHILEFDDVHGPSIYHPGAPTIAAALALADRIGCSGDEFAAAIVAGYEVGIRVGEAAGVEHYHRHHTTGTVGCIGAAAAAARVLGLDATATASALGHAATSAAALWSFRDDRADSKPLHAAHAAMVGVLSADLARAGLRGSSAALDGPYGFFRVLGGDPHAPALLAGLGCVPERITGISLKAYPCCGHTHSGIDAALAVVERLGERPPTEIAAIHVRTYGAAIAVAGLRNPETAAQAAFSYAYILGHLLGKGSLAGAFVPDGIADPVAADVAALVVLVQDDEFDDAYPKEQPAQVEVTLSNGEVFTEMRRHPMGSPANPLTYAQHTDKLQTLLGAAAEDALKLSQLMLNSDACFGGAR